MKTSNRILTFLLAISIVANAGLGAICIKKSSTINNAHTRMLNVYEEGLCELCVRCEQIDQGFSKLSVTTKSSQALRILSEIIDDAAAASVALDALPISPEYTHVLNRYLNHVGDYSKYMMFACANGTLPATNYTEQITALKQSSGKITQALNNMTDNMNGESYDWTRYLAESVSELDIISDDLFSVLESIQTEGINYPTLIYDGPFSDSVVNRVIDEGQAHNVTESEAISAFCKFVSIPSAYKIISCDSCDGVISTWCIALQYGQVTYYGNVSKKTGKVISFLCDSNAANKNYSRNDAENIAGEFLSRNGYDSMKPQYSEVTQNIATINFVYEQNGVLIYPDMVKVRVNLDNGKVEGFEGLSFIANHKDRQITNYEFNVPDDILPNGCNVEKTSLAIIPTDGGDERLCIEVRCNVDDDDFVLYFDPETFDEVKIFKVIHTENSDFAV